MWLKTDLDQHCQTQNETASAYKTYLVDLILNVFKCWPTVSQIEMFLYSAAAAAKSFQSCPTLCDPIDGSPPGSPVPGILQARTLEWVAISFSNAWKWKVKVKLLSRVWLLATPWTAAHQAPLSMGFSRQEYWSGMQWIDWKKQKYKWGDWERGCYSVAGREVAHFRVCAGSSIHGAGGISIISNNYANHSCYKTLCGYRENWPTADIINSERNLWMETEDTWELVKWKIVEWEGVSDQHGGVYKADR